MIFIYTERWICQLFVIKRKEDSQIELKFSEINNIYNNNKYSDSEIIITLSNHNFDYAKAIYFHVFMFLISKLLFDKVIIISESDVDLWLLLILLISENNFVQSDFFPLVNDWQNHLYV